MAALYLKALEAENWAAAETFTSQRLAKMKPGAERLTWANSSVVWAVTQVIPNQIDAALQNGFIKLAEMRLASSKVFAATLPEAHRAHFADLERKIAEARANAD